jgi:hypothetical protein
MRGLDREVALERQIHRRLRGYVGYRATQAINRIGSKLAAISVAEIGDVTSRLPLRSDSLSSIASKLECRKDSSSRWSPDKAGSNARSSA